MMGAGNRARSLMRAAVASGRFTVEAVTNDDATLPVNESPAFATIVTLAARTFTTATSDFFAGLDAVAIAVPNFRHAEAVDTAIAAGVAVFLEKPIATHYDDVKRCIEASQHHLLHVGTELRYAPFIGSALQMVNEQQDRPDIGWVRECREPFRPGVRDWRQSQEATAGTFVEKNCHHFDLMSLLFNDRPVHVNAVGRADEADQPLSHGSVLVEWSRGGSSVLQVDLRHDVGHGLQLGLAGNHWDLEYDTVTDQLRWTTDTQTGTTPLTEPKGHWRHAGWDHPGEVEQWHTFAAMLDGAPGTTALETHSHLWGHAAAFAAELSAREHTAIRISAEGDLT